jgi:hypothetical protein
MDETRRIFENITLGKAASDAWQTYNSLEYNPDFGKWFGGHLTWLRADQKGFVTVEPARTKHEVKFGPDPNFIKISVFDQSEVAEAIVTINQSDMPRLPIDGIVPTVELQEEVFELLRSEKPLLSQRAVIGSFAVQKAA